MHSATPLSSPPGTRRSPELVRARVAVCLVFLANGLGFANLVPRFPEIVVHLGLRPQPVSALSWRGWPRRGSSPA